MADFKRATPLQEKMLQKLTEAVADYIKVVELPVGSRHRRTTLTFTGDRYKPLDIVCKYVTPRTEKL